ncbi:MAG: DUF58 domain-containing protein [Endomicrobiia bacterium]
MNFKYADPNILQLLNNFIFEPDSVVEGKHTGKHRSFSIGRSLEFVQHREYTQTDDLKYIDWKVYARRDRFFIKQYYQETNLESWIFIDCSKSMWFPENGKEITKYEYANYIASYLSYILLKQGDSVGIAKFDNKIKSLLEKSSKEKFYYKILQFLEEEIIGDKTKFVNIIDEILKFAKKRMFLIFISDLIINNEIEVVRLFKKISSYGINVLILHIIHPKEYDLNWIEENRITFEDVEYLKQITTEIDEIKKLYQKELNKILEYYKTQLNNKNINYFLINTKLPVLENLQLIISQK